MNSNLRLRMTSAALSSRDARIVDRGLAPGIEGAECGRHGGIHLRCASLLMNADDLRRARGIDGANPLSGSHALAADDERVIAAEMHGHLIESVAHGARILGVAEVGERLIRKHALRRARLDGGRDTCDGHNPTSLRQIGGVSAVRKDTRRRFGLDTSQDEGAPMPRWAATCRASVFRLTGRLGETYTSKPDGADSPKSIH